MANKRTPVLKKHKEFNDIKVDGRRVRLSPWLLFTFLVNDFGHLRAGWTISSKVGGAVQRNRYKRWCRQFFNSLNLLDKSLSFDVNIVFLAGTLKDGKELKYEEFKLLMEKGISQLRKAA